MTPRRLRAPKERVQVDLDPTKIALLDVLSEQLDLSRDETVSEALNALFVSVYRRGD